MSKNPTEFDELTSKLNRETAKIEWALLEKFFAQGKAVWVAPSEDLIAVAKWMAEDNAKHIGDLMERGLLAKVSDEMASRWSSDASTVWAVVSAPWVLVQDITDTGN